MRLLLFLSLIIQSVSAVDRSKFKTCEQAKFCNRHRHLKTGQTPAFHINSESVKFEDASITATLVRQNDQRQFSLVIGGLADATLRMTIDEVNGLRKRFRADDALNDPPPKPVNFKLASKGSGSLSILHGDGHKLVIHYRPFRVDIYSGKDDLVMSLNSQQLMKIEHFRIKSDQVVEEQKNDDEMESAQTTESKLPEDEPDGFWSENFQTHEDRKPHGSSSVGMDVSLIGFEHVYGLPEHADSFALKSTSATEPYRLYNLDVFEYELNSPMALYGSIPYLIAHSMNRTVGILWLNAAETWVDIHSSTADKGILKSLVDSFRTSTDTPQIDAHFISESGLVDVFVFLGPTVKDVAREYSQLTGVMPLPPLFSLAYHQCRWNYNDEDDVRQVDANFDYYDIPYDVLWLDIEHTDGKRYFTWDQHKFPTPIKMQENLAAKQRKMVTIIDPHIKRDDNYKVYAEAKGSDFYVKDRNGQEYDGHCWSGSSAYLDFFNSKTRDYWASHFKYDRYEGSTKDLFVWNDMNEPSVFSGPEITMHKDAMHANGFEHRDVHNMYGFQQHRATYQGLYEREQGAVRPFVLTRSFYAGSQRYSAVWTGDNAAQWSHLQASLPMMLTLSLSGIPFVGADVGGFFGNPDEQLLCRWYQTGAFSPFFRAHAHIDTKRREPWLFSDASRETIRAAIRRRYELLPYWYTLFAEHERSGMPVLRSTMMEFPMDKNTWDEEREFMLGGALLVRPVIEPDVSRVSVYLPSDELWYDWDTLRGRPGPGAVQVDTPMDKIPVFQRGGTVIPLRERVRRSSALMRDDPMTLRIALAKTPKEAVGEIYLDDGTSYEYKTKQQYLRRTIKWASEGAYSASITNSDASDKSGKLKSEVQIERIIIMGLDFFPQDVHVFSDDYNPRALDFTFNRDSMSMVLHKVNVNVGLDWRIDVHG